MSDTVLMDEPKSEPRRVAIRRLRGQLASAHAYLLANPDDPDAQKAHVDAQRALAVETEGRISRRRRAFQAELERLGAGGPDGDPRNVWMPLTFSERIRITPVVQDLWFALTYWTGLRDRLRCPRCTAVGTFKMHGSLLERWIYKDIHVRRWMCKYCGYYIGPRGRIQVFPSRRSGAWALPDPDPETGLIERDPTPAEVLREGLGKTWPWYG